MYLPCCSFTDGSKMRGVRRIYLNADSNVNVTLQCSAVRTHVWCCDTHSAQPWRTNFPPKLSQRHVVWYICTISGWRVSHHTTNTVAHTQANESIRRTPQRVGRLFDLHASEWTESQRRPIAFYRLFPCCPSTAPRVCVHHNISHIHYNHTLITPRNLPSEDKSSFIAWSSKNSKSSESSNS